MAREGTLVRVQVGKKGLTHELLDQIGLELEKNEIVRLDVLKSGREARLISAEFLEFTLPLLLDCVAVKVKGHSVTLFRDKSLPLPSRGQGSGLDASSSSQEGHEQLDEDDVVQGRRAAEAMAAVAHDHGNTRGRGGRSRQ